MELILPFSFNDFPEDVQIRILSFLHPWELDLFARTSTRFLALCRDDERLWFLKCDRRWGSQTQIQDWGGRKISYRKLYHFLEKHENLIGFWHMSRYSRTSSPPLSPPLLVCFEWGSFYITGYMISPSKCGGYGVTKKPFLWITATSNGKGLNYLDTDGRAPLAEKDLLKEDSKKLLGGLIIADILLSSYNCCSFSLRENYQFFEFRKRLSTRNGQEECESVYRSPPDGLMTQIYETLSNKRSVTGDATSNRGMRRERRREREKWRRVLMWDGKDFQKIIECSPTPSRPFQGLWKGICLDRSLNFYLVYYREEFDQIRCENVGGSSTMESYSDLVFGASSISMAFIRSPHSLEEESIYNSRAHVRPRAQANQSVCVQVISSHDVSRILYVDSDHGNSTLSYLTGNFDDADGRVWLYKNGTFGFGFLRDDFIVDLMPVLKNGLLLDLMV